MTRLSKNAQVLRYLLEQAPGLGHTKLLKYAYLADLEARRYLGHPISEFQYQRYNYGPFAPDFYTAKEESVDGGWATSSRTWVGNYQAYCVEPTPRGVEYDFTREESEVLRFVSETYFSLSAREICGDIVYATEPMAEAQMNDELPMSKVDRKGDEPFAFGLTRMLDGECRARAKQSKPLADAMNELRTRNH